MAGRLFDSLVDHRRGFSCIAPQLPGYPGSVWPAGLSFDQQLERMQQSFSSGHLVGWSLGGLYAIELAARFSGQFSSLTLIASNPCFVKKAGWDCAIEEAVFDGFHDSLIEDWRPTLRRFLALQMQGEADARQLTREITREVLSMESPDLETLSTGLGLLKSVDARDKLSELEMPVKLILGERDRLVPIELAQQIREVLPTIQVESVAGAGHAPFLSHSRQVAAMLPVEI